MLTNLSVFLLRVLAAVAGLAILCVLIFFLIRASYPSPEAALAAFYKGSPGFECNIADPLRNDGRRVVPLVLRDLPDKSMRYRRYAIGFLGEHRYVEALPVLERILADITEKDYFRADALLAIYEIAPVRAQSLVTSVENPTGLLDRVVKAIGRGESAVKEMIDHSCP
jgi:hypothetical protein